MKASKIDFVPGERTIFYDDFSDWEPDSPPPHWRVRDGKAVLRIGGGINELFASDTVTLSLPKIAIPTNFTLEFEFYGPGEVQWHLASGDTQDFDIHLHGSNDGTNLEIFVSQPSGTLADVTVPTQKEDSQPVHFAFWAQQGRVRAYLNGERVMDVNQVEFGAIDRVEAINSLYNTDAWRKVRFAESAPDFSTVIASTGKYVTHGILFDTDSARLKPESAPVLKLVAAGLTKNPNLKLEIDGYTDSVGNPAHNLDLSKRRAQAVQSVLVTQFAIDAGRLTANGFGSAKPIGSNDTPDGRASNRRVEFIKK
jgi:outer membrane protein OmpA-like peptidoglycan-associated protein